MGNRLISMLLPVAMVVAVAGCSVSTSGTPTTAITVGTSTDSTRPPTSPSKSAPANRYGAPHVENPLDATKYLTQPCAAISPRLLQSLGLPTQGEPDTEGAAASGAPACNWWAGDELAHATFLQGNKNGLADLYHQHEYFKDHKYWEETTVEGYPAVFYDTVDDRSAGRCSIAVGLNDSLAVAVRESGRLGAGSCERAKNVALAMVQTLKGQG